MSTLLFNTVEEMNMADGELNEGKMEITERIKEIARENNFSDIEIMWSQSSPGSKKHSVELRNKSGFIADQVFSEDQLRKYKSDNRCKFQVHEKILSLRLKLEDKKIAK
jgi:hypothetical protein